MNIETSRISTIFGDDNAPKGRLKSPLSPVEMKQTKKPSPQKKYDPNDLNNWEICNPDHFEDKLP